jgi:hypothetical protein
MISTIVAPFRVRSIWIRLACLVPARVLVSAGTGRALAAFLGPIALALPGFVEPPRRARGRRLQFRLDAQGFKCLVSQQQGQSLIVFASAPYRVLELGRCLFDQSSGYETGDHLLRCAAFQVCGQGQDTAVDARWQARLRTTSWVSESFIGCSR